MSFVHCNTVWMFLLQTIVRPSEITEWTDDDGKDTALCPYCSVDSVIPDLDNSLNEELLEAMNRTFF